MGWCWLVRKVWVPGKGRAADGWVFHVLLCSQWRGASTAHPDLAQTPHKACSFHPRKRKGRVLYWPWVIVAAWQNVIHVLHLYPFPTPPEALQMRNALTRYIRESMDVLWTLFKSKGLLTMPPERFLRAVDYVYNVITQVIHCSWPVLIQCIAYINCLN